MIVNYHSPLIIKQQKDHHTWR